MKAVSSDTTRDAARQPPQHARSRRAAGPRAPAATDARADVLAQARLGAALTQRPDVQSLRGAQQALDASPRVALQAQHAQTLATRPSAAPAATGTAQLVTEEREEPATGSDPVQAAVGTEAAPGAALPRPNPTGLPDTLKAGLEAASGIDLSPLRVHYNASQPARIGALAYAQGDHIYLGPGQEKHLPHEGWHAVQQRQGRVPPTGKVGGQAVNDDASLEREADVMGGRAAQMRPAAARSSTGTGQVTGGTAQRTAASVAQLAFDPQAFRDALADANYAEAARLAGQAAGAADLFARLNDVVLGLPGAEQDQLLQRLHHAYQASQTPWVKLELWRVWASQSHVNRVLGAGLPGERVADVGGLYDDILNAGRLLGLRQQRENTGFLSLFGADARRARHLQEIDALAARSALAQELSFRHQIGIRNRTLPQDITDEQRLARERNFSTEELRVLESVLARLPAAHVAQNEFLLSFQRADRNEDAQGAGAEYRHAARGVQVFDLGFGGNYRAAGSRSEIGEHPAEAPLRGGEEVLTHEIGHSVERARPEGYAALRAAAGWQDINDAPALRLMLTGDGMGGAAADAFIGRLQATRDERFYRRHTEVRGDYVYMVDPYSDGFLRRRVNRMVGDAATTETIPQGGRSLMPYAQSAPTEFFAELYAQMVHVPERVYENYIGAPARRMQEAAALVPPEGTEGHAAARAAFTERQAQADALRDQWVAMREQVFGVNHQSEAVALQGLRGWADGQGIAQVNRAVPLADFRRAVVMAATPHQIAVLVQRAQAAMQQRQQQNPVVDPLPPPPEPAHEEPPPPEVLPPPGQVVEAPQQVVVEAPQDQGGGKPPQDVGQLRAAPARAPVLQAHLAARGALPTGTLAIDFATRNPRYGFGFAQERGHITFDPGPGAPDTDAIEMEQLAKLEAERQELPDEHDLLLEGQKTRGDGGAEAGFVIDQVPKDLDERLGQAEFTRALKGGRAHVYAETGAEPTVGLLSVLRRVDASEDPAAAVVDTGLPQHQLALLQAWMAWAREEGYLGRELTRRSVAMALIRTVQDKRGVAPRLLEWASGLDVDLVRQVQTYVAANEGAQSVEELAGGELFREPALKQNVRGWKAGEYAHPATLWDTPGSKYPAKFAFKTAPFDVQHGEYLGGYVEWGFEVVAVPHAGRVAVDPDSEYARIEDEMWDDYTATAAEAKAHFYSTWGRRNASRGYTQIGPDHYEKDGHLYNYVRATMDMVPLPPHVTRADLRRVLYPPPPEPPGRDLQSGSRQVAPQVAPLRLAPTYTVTGYKTGQLGVYFMEGPLGELVVKPIPSVFNEMFAVRLAGMLGIRQPLTRAVSAGSPDGVAFTEAILGSQQRDEYLERFKRVPPNFFLVMSRVGGTTLEAAQESGVGSLAPLGDLGQFVADLGQITAFDILLYYRDRTSLIGGGNLANLMLEKAPNLRGVALDQRVNVKERGLFDSRPLEQIQRVVQEIVAGDEKRLEYLWDDLPQAIQEGLGGKARGLALLQKSLLAGLVNVVRTLSPEALMKLYEELSVLKLPPAQQSASSSSWLPSPAAGADDVDLKALIGSLEAIKTGLGSSLEKW